MDSKTKKLNEKNNMLDKEISKENQGIFTDMICYLHGSNLSEYDIEIVRQDLTEMVLSAQKRGENIGSVIGNNYKEFCDEVIASIPSKTKMEKFIGYLDSSCWALSILLAINIIISKETISIIGNVISRNPVNFNISFSVGSVISIGLIFLLSNLIVSTIVKNTFRKEIKHKKTVGFVIGATFMMLMMIIAWLGKGTLFTINIFLICFFTITLYVGHKLLETL